MTKQLGIFVKRATREPVVDTLKIIKRRYLPNNKIIAISNPLYKDAISAISNHKNDDRAFTLKNHEVGTYLAASSLSHLLDGWGYLANATNSYLNGNAGVAIHLAYYAELRAIMAFLSSEGIGVFSNDHLGVSENGSFEVFSKYKRTEWVKGQGNIVKNNKVGTHVFAWEALSKWCRSEVKPTFDILRIFKVKGFNFSELIQGFHPSATELISSNITKNWLKDWAFDVKKYKNDRDLRNNVSYRPQTLSDFDRHPDLKKSIEDVYSLFQVLSPLQSNPFNYLDTLLLKALFEELYQIPIIEQSGRFSDLVENSFTNLGAALDIQTRNILLSGVSNVDQHIIFEESNKFETQPLPIISRAALLLRMATGSTSLLLSDASILKEELDFIWSSYGIKNGFWETASPVSDFHRLWSDIENEYTEISSNFDRLNNNLYTYKNELDEDISRLSQYNRAVLWGI
uniref:Uncharacterized protein n=1 Tax=Roseihalotalea indica TaxID=2867963 RepID=A0AA49GLH0_9BACT|nr:hypothetical protein K4G66_18555 [Tunicatimonas sp. TK19036]